MCAHHITDVSVQNYLLTLLLKVCYGEKDRLDTHGIDITVIIHFVDNVRFAKHMQQKLSSELLDNMKITVQLAVATVACD